MGADKWGKSRLESSDGDRAKSVWVEEWEMRMDGKYVLQVWIRRGNRVAAGGGQGF